MLEPWYKTTLSLTRMGKSLKFQIPYDVFSTQRIDEGTLLFLDHLPKRPPSRVLDMGCGYGALGLPIAAQFPQAKIEMVDRDLLAAEWSQKNAASNELSNVNAHGSLGFDRIQHTEYDWILCNIPARIGTPFIKNFMEAGACLLTSLGELRVVVISDLGPILKDLQKEWGWPLTEVAVGPRHSIFSMSQMTGPKIKPQSPLELYYRDTVSLKDLEFKRPFDVGGDDQKRIKTSLPILLDTLPRRPLEKNSRVLCFRSYYGITPLIARKVFPETRVQVYERDLLSLYFLNENAKNLGFAGENLAVTETPSLSEDILHAEKFDLILGELSPSAGALVACSELSAAHRSLKADGQALILCLEKTDQEWIKCFSEREKIQIQRVLTREGFTVIRLSH